MSEAYICFETQSGFCEIAPALEIVAHGSCHRKFTLCKLLRPEIPTDLCIAQFVVNDLVHLLALRRAWDDAQAHSIVALGH